MKKLYAATTGLLLAVSLLCGCDKKESGTAETASVKIIEPAMIISREDAKALTGVNFGECTVKEEPRVGLKMCVYDKDGALLQLGLIQVAFMDQKTRAGGNTPESIYTTTKSAFKDAGKIEGVGDDNFLAPPGLHILKGGYYLTVSMGMSKDKEKLKAAGLKAVENLNKYSGK